MRERAARVRMLVLDVDGVLTDGRVMYDDEGREIKSFDVKDGHGLRLLMRAGIEVVLLSGRPSGAVEYRAQELGIREVFLACTDKGAVLQELLRRKGLSPQEVCCVGDDLVDLPLFQEVGLAVAVANAAPELKARAHYVTNRPGGRGAVREVCELILKAQGRWEELIGCPQA